MKELLNSHQDKKGFLQKARKLTATEALLVVLSACDKTEITEGTVYKKEYTEKKSWTLLHLVGGKVPIQLSMESPEKRRLYISQCPTEETCPLDRIEKDCKTNSFVVLQEVFNSLEIGQYADFKQPK